MFKVLLIDDEPLVLTGIKHMLDWSLFDCEVVGSANDGKQGLEMIDSLAPDIVICDINMPVVNGMDVLKRAGEKASFILLTNLQEFELVRVAMQNRVLEYLVKNQLSREILEKALLRAIQDCETRKSVAIAKELQENKADFTPTMLSTAMENILLNQHSFQSKEAVQRLSCSDMLHQYGMVFITLLPQQGDESNQEKRNIWMRELTKNLAARCFEKEMCFLSERPTNTLAFFTWNNTPSLYRGLVSDFYEKLLNISQRMTKVKFCFLATECFGDVAKIDSLKENYRYAVNCQFNEALPCVLPSKVKPEPFIDAAFEREKQQLVRSVQLQNLAQCGVLLAFLRDAIQSNLYDRRSVLRFSSGLLNALVEETVLGNQEIDVKFLQDSLYSFVEKSLLLNWYLLLEQCLVRMLDSTNSTANSTVAAVKAYIQNNIEKKLSLTELANVVFVSPNYLSTQFKKEEGVGISEYISKMKIEEACRMLRDEQHTIFEISERLAFDSPNYFTRVFKRYVGQTPSEYQRVAVQHTYLMEK